MNLNRKNWDYPKNVLFSEKLQVSQTLISPNKLCIPQNQYFKYNSENLPVFGNKNVYDTYTDENGLSHI